MGNWAFAILAGDLAQDVAGDVRELIEARKASPSAIRCIRERYLAEVGGDEAEAAEVILAIAAALYEAGRIDDEAYARALDVITHRRGLDRWREQGPETEAARIAAYDEMAQALRAGPRPRTGPRLRTPRLGEVLRIPLPDGRFAYGHCVLSSKMLGVGLEILGTSTTEFTEPPTVKLDQPRFGPLFCGVGAGVRYFGWRIIGRLPVPAVPAPVFIFPVGSWDSGRWEAFVDDEVVYDGTNLPVEYRRSEFYGSFPPEWIVERIMRGGDPEKWYRYPGAPAE